MTADPPQSPTEDGRPPRKRRRWQFGLSTLLLVVTACAVASWWYAQESREAFQERFTKRVSDLGGALEWGSGELPTRISFRHWGLSVDPARKALTDELLGKLKRDLARLGPFSLNLSGSPAARGAITDAGLAHLDGLDKLECLSLRHTDVTDAGLEHLAKLKGLELLDLRDTKVTDAGACWIPSVRPDLIAVTDWAEKQLPEGSLAAVGPQDNQAPIAPRIPTRITMPFPRDGLGASIGVRTTLSTSLYGSDPDIHVQWLSAIDAVISLHGPISDSGVFVARVDATDPANAKLLWQAFAEPLGVGHSKYHHEVQLFVQGDRCVLVSDGAETFVEIRELATGKLLKRWVY